MNWEKLNMSQRSELISIYLKNGITSLDEMKKHYNSLAEGGNTSPSYPPFNKTPQRTDISDNEKRARGKWHVENAKGNQQSVITKAFNEAKSKGLTTEQAYEYVADVAKQYGWSKEGSNIGERTIKYRALPNINSSDNNVSQQYFTSEPISEEEYQRRVTQQTIRQSQQSDTGVIYDSDEKAKRDNPNNPRTPFEPHPITPKEMDVTLKGLKFLQPFDPTGLTGVPDFLNSVASSKGIGINFVGMLPAIGKVKAVENGSRLARFNNSLMDTGEEVLGNLIGRISPKAGNFINTTTSAVQDITTKPATEIVKQLMQNSGTRAANRFATGWNLGATTANFGRAGEDVYDLFTEDPLVQRVKEGFQFAEGGSIDDPPEEYEKYKYGIPTAEETDNRLYQSSFGTLLPEVKIVAKGDPRKVNNDYYKAHSRARANIQEAVQTAPGWQLATLGAMAPAAYMLAPAAYAGMTNPLVDAALTTHGAITAPKNIREGISEIKEGNYGKGALNLGLTAFDLLGAGNLVGRPARLLSKNFRRNLTYRTIKPFGYQFTFEDGKEVLKGIWNKHYYPKAVQNVHEEHPLRAAAFRKYLGLEDDITKKLFVPRSDGTFNIDPETAIALNKNVGINPLTEHSLNRLYTGEADDHIYNIMGGLGGSEVYSLGSRGILRMTDTWDLQPFKGIYNSPKFRLAKGIEELGSNIRRYTYGKKLLKPLDKLADKMQDATFHVNINNQANNWLRNLEIGPILGGKPFNIDARIPFNINGGFPVYDASANIPSLEQAIMAEGDKVVYRRVKEPFEQFVDGGQIRIKPENRGKFTALKERTGHSATWFKENGTPAQKKMAIFELNSKKWRK